MASTPANVGCSALQIFIKGEFVGGADILMSMHESGELSKTLEPVLKQQTGQK